MNPDINPDISADPDRLDIDEISNMLAHASWSQGITKNEIVKGIRNSALVVGAYDDKGRQIGFLRVISDEVRFAYILDVIVAENQRRRGIGQAMVRFAMAHPDLRGVYQWLLKTSDAQGVYAHCGFAPLEDPERWIGVIKARPDRADYRI